MNEVGKKGLVFIWIVVALVIAWGSLKDTPAEQVPLGVLSCSGMTVLGILSSKILWLDLTARHAT